MARVHTMTPARRAALRRAQLASAAKRRGTGKTHPAISPKPTAPKLNSPQAQRRRRRKTALAVGAGVVAAGAIGYSQAHSPRSYTRTAASRHHYAREHAAMHNHLLLNVAGQVNRSRIQNRKPMGPFDFKAARRQNRRNARRAAAANFPKGAVYKQKNVMRAQRAKVRASRVRRTPKRTRRRTR